jgi:enoyl-CoA hydratase/carnithine racemase
VYAGGILIVACANYVISKNNIKLSLPEVKRGLFPFQVMDSLLRTMPKRAVIDWCIRGKEMNAMECKKLNLIQETDSKDLDIKANNWLADIVKMSPNAIKSGLKTYEELYIDNDSLKLTQTNKKRMKHNEESCV